MSESVNSTITQPRLQVGGSLTENALYVERSADAEIYESLFTGELCYVLAPRQMGKSSLCSRAARHLRQNQIHCVHIDLNVIGGQVNAPDAERWYYSLIKELSRRLSFARGFADTFFSKHANDTNAYRLKVFFRDEILGQIKGKIVLIFDEIDTVLSLPFSVDDFFAVVRDAFNSRADDLEYRRLTFCFVGVATPAQLMRNAVRTPFNVGRGIVLNDFERSEAGPFLQALVGIGQNPNAAESILTSVFDWTSGHPYMTHKLCAHLVQTSATDPLTAEAVAQAVQRLFLADGQTGDTNLQYAAKRIEAVTDLELRTRLLRLYRRLREEETVVADPNEPLQAELRLCGLVRYESGLVRVRNRIFATVYDVAWVHEKELVRRLDDAIEHWRRADKRSEFLLNGPALAEAWEWAQQQRRTTPEENEFLLASMDEAKRLAGRRAVMAILVALVLVVASGLVVALVFLERIKSEAKTQAERAAVRLAIEKQKREFSEQSLALERQRVAAEKQKLEAEKQKVEAEKREKQAVEEKLRAQEQLVAKSEETQLVLAQKAELAQRDEQRAKEQAQTDQLLREQTELSKLPLLLKQPGSRLQALVDSIKALDAAEQAGHPLPDGLLSALMQSAGDFVYSYPLPHRDRVLACQFSPDGSILAAGCADGTIYLWDVKSRKLLRSLSGHQGPVHVLRFRPRADQGGPKSDFLASGGEDGKVILWHVATGVRSHSFAGHSRPVQFLDFSSNGEYLASGGRDQTVHIWSVIQLGQVAGLLKFDNSLIGVGFINLYDKSGTTKNAQDTLIAMDIKGSIAQWGTVINIERPQLTVNLTGLYVDRTKKDIFSREHRIDRIFVAEQGQKFRYLTSAYWRKEPTRPSFLSVEEDYSAIQSSSVQSRSGMLAVGYPNGEAHIAERYKSRSESVNWVLEGHRKQINDVTIDPGTKRIATASSDNTARVWEFGKARVDFDVAWISGTQMRRQSIQTNVKIDNYSVSKDHLLMLFVDDEKKYYLELRNAVTAEQFPLSAQFSYSRPFSAELLGNGDIIKLTFQRTMFQFPKTEYHFNIDSAEARTVAAVLSSLKPKNGEFLTVLPDNQHVLLTASASTGLSREHTPLNILNIKTKETKVFLWPASWRKLYPAPDGRQVIVQISGTTALQLWDLITGHLVRSLDPTPEQVGGEERMVIVAFASDSKRVLLGYSDRTARLWDLETGRYLHTLRGHEDQLVAAAFSKDGRKVTTAGLDRVVNMWDVQSGQRHFSLHTTGLVPIGLSSNGERVLLNNSGTSIIIRLATPDAFYKFACRLLGEFDDHERTVRSFCKRHVTEASPVATE